MRTATEVQRETGQPRGARPDYAPAPLTASTDRANGSPWVRHASGHRRRSAPRANRSTPLRPGSIPATESPDAIGVPASLAHLEGSVAGTPMASGDSVAGIEPGRRGVDLLARGADVRRCPEACRAQGDPLARSVDAVNGAGA